MSSSSTAPSAHHASRPRRKNPLARVFAAQESGLLLVIALMMAALTLLGGEKAKPYRVDVASGVEVRRNSDFFIVPAELEEVWYARDAGWEVDRSTQPPTVKRRADVAEVVERAPVPANAEIDDAGDVITVRVGDTSAEYAVADGWRVDETDGVKSLVKERRVSRLEMVADSIQGDIKTSAGQIVVTNSGVRAYYPERVGWRYIEESETSRYLIGSVVVNRFFEKENLVLLMTKASYFAVIAVGMTAIIVLAGIDLSVGSVYAVAAIIGGMALGKLDPNASAWTTVPVAVLVCCAVGAALGLANGAMIVGLRLHPFIITLGTMAVYRGFVLLLTGGQTISDIPESIQRNFFKAEYAGVYPVLSIIMVIVAIIGTFVLSKTVLGRRIYAIGGNETAAVYAGVPVGRVKMLVYTLGGLLAGLSACMEVGYNATATVGAGQGYELNVVAAAVIGGASLSGGRGSAIGAVLGAILVSLIDNAMVILDINQNYNQVVMGGAIIIAVTVDQVKRRYL